MPRELKFLTASKTPRKSPLYRQNGPEIPPKKNNTFWVFFRYLGVCFSKFQNFGLELPGPAISGVLKTLSHLQSQPLNLRPSLQAFRARNQNKKSQKECFGGSAKKIPRITNPGTTPITILAANSDHGLSFVGEETRTMVWVSFCLQIYSTFEFWRFKFAVVWVLVWVSSFYGDGGGSSTVKKRRQS